jgi:Family of unknown function (DUF6527)
VNQVSRVLRRTEGGFAHWCPGCEEVHLLPKSWKFDGNLERPTFSPSFKHTGLKRVFVDGNWTGMWKRDGQGNCIPYICHYHITAGEIDFCGECTHQLRGKMPLPPLPEGFRDEAI